MLGLDRGAEGAARPAAPTGSAKLVAQLKAAEKQIADLQSRATCSPTSARIAGRGARRCGASATSRTAPTASRATTCARWRSRCATGSRTGRRSSPWSAARRTSRAWSSPPPRAPGPRRCRPASSSGRPARPLGGRGGGKDDIAQGGGTDGSEIRRRSAHRGRAARRADGLQTRRVVRTWASCTLGQRAAPPGCPTACRSRPPRRPPSRAGGVALQRVGPGWRCRTVARGAAGDRLGDARIGVAACDPDGVLAYPLTHRAGGADRDRRAGGARRRARADGGVVGLPTSLSGTEGPAARQARERAEAAPRPRRDAGRRCGCRRAVDTVERAPGGSREGGKRAKQQRGVIDAAAAAHAHPQEHAAERRSESPG